mmetsp:Transcript_14793/g.33001  ORF Transcript_14793/g.33001 Transcript_14793/m.33001 type:complete len:178 (+) Transcript_14793:737-1270(+)
MQTPLLIAASAIFPQPTPPPTSPTPAWVVEPKTPPKRAALKPNATKTHANPKQNATVGNKADLSFRSPVAPLIYDIVSGKRDRLHGLKDVRRPAVYRIRRDVGVRAVRVVIAVVPVAVPVPVADTAEVAEVAEGMEEAARSEAIRWTLKISSSNAGRGIMCSAVNVDGDDDVNFDEA